ncbi:MbnP family protein [Membranihabitans maritimus]|uniref:MbnP family protein n=1 Tax=Membranihabitans maritimus TaxID=2904244 RepID=UPI001F33995F|nr:MbnP family protein [Membranihabitans maritimus]
MKRLLIVFFALAFLFSCEKEDIQKGGSLTLEFRLLYDGQVVSTPEKEYELNDSITLRFSKVSYYLSDLQLNIDSTNYLDLDTEGDNIFHISFLQTILGDAIPEPGVTLNFNNLPNGNYSSVSFGLGVAPAFNSSEPSNFISNHPLSFSSEYWSPWESYIFSKIEGEFSVSGGESESLALHTGSDQAYREIQVRGNLSLSENSDKVLRIDLDLKEVLESYPLLEAPRIHQRDQQNYVDMIADGMNQSLTN